MTPIGLYEPVYGGPGFRGRLLYQTTATVRRGGQRATVEEEGGDVQIGIERVRVTYLDPRLAAGHYARVLGFWYKVAGVRPVPPYGIGGDLQLELYARVQIVE